MADLPEYTLRDVEDHKSDNWTVIDGEFLAMLRSLRDRLAQATSTMSLLIWMSILEVWRHSRKLQVGLTNQ